MSLHMFNKNARGENQKKKTIKKQTISVYKKPDY